MCATKQCPTLKNHNVTHIKNTCTSFPFSKISKHEKCYSRITLDGDNAPSHIHYNWNLIHIELNYGNKYIYCSKY